MATKLVPVTISLSGSPDTKGTASVLDRSPQNRAMRAVGGMLIFWALAAMFLPVPGFHFVAVPGFLVAGVVFGIFRLKERQSLMGTDGVCPRCQVTKKFPPSGRYADGGTIHCDQCGSLLTITPAA